MSSRMTVLREDGVRALAHDTMSDTAFVHAVEAGWRQGEAVASGEDGYYFFICRMDEPVWNKAGTQQTKSGVVTVERHRVH